jgi:phospholipid/cholesterol/gamma-HCH transport system substrate-binding protein
MEKDANYFAVGLFVSIALLVLVGFLIWLMGVHTSGRYDRYTVYFKDPVSGLTDKGVVRYMGVDVGKVVALRLTDDHPEIVKVDIEVKEKTPVAGGTEAKIAMQGITGTSSIELSTDRNDKTKPKIIAGEKYPVLEGKGSALSKFFDGLPQVGNQLQTTLSSIDEFSRGSTKMVESIRDLADKLKEDPSQIIHGPNHKGVEIPK